MTIVKIAFASQTINGQTKKHCEWFVLGTEMGYIGARESDTTVSTW